MSTILDKLKGGDLRSIGRADEVVGDIFEQPGLFGHVFSGMLADDPIVRMRAADVIEKVARERPSLLQPYKKRLIKQVSKVNQQEVRWHAAQMFAYLTVSKRERDEIVDILFEYIDGPEKSKIVKTFSMQTLADFTERDKTIRPRIVAKLEELVRTGSPAMKSRGKKLLTKLKQK